MLLASPTSRGSRTGGGEGEALGGILTFSEFAKTSPPELSKNVSRKFNFLKEDLRKKIKTSSLNLIQTD